MKKHYENLIVGGGPAGLYMAWRLSAENKSAAIFEWSPIRLGGRIFTKTFEEGQFLELGGMRFSEDHLLLMAVLRHFQLTEQIVDFPMTDDRLFYLRGKHKHQSDIYSTGAPYETARHDDRYANTDELFQRVADNVLGENQPKNRAEWMRFYDQGVLSPSTDFKEGVYKEGDLLGKIGYWNLMLDQLGTEAFSYVKDAGGYSSNVINWNAANAVHTNGTFGSSGTFKMLKEGYSQVFRALERECRERFVEINKGQRLIEFYWNAVSKKFHCTFVRYDKSGEATNDKNEVTCDNLLLCVPKHAIELISENDVVGPWSHKPRRVLKHPTGQYYIESIIDQPAYKIGLMYESAWWCEADYKPNLKKPMDSKSNYGPTVTDLPLRQVFYFGNNNAKLSRPLYGILASYDDMQNSKFWEVLELEPDETIEGCKSASEHLQPLFEGAPVPKIMLKMLRKLLNELHFEGSDLKVPEPVEGYFMNWGRSPYGAGYHAWKAHYKLADAQYYMTRPSETIGVDVPLYVAGSAYSNDPEWVEGAFCTAETILIDKYGLKSIIDLKDYPLICRPKDK